MLAPPSSEDWRTWAAVRPRRLRHRVREFTYLKKLPIDYLKIDIDFVRDLTTNPANRHLVKAVVALAHGFGAQTIAEESKTKAHSPCCGIEQVDFAQGFHVGRPAPVAPHQGPARMQFPGLRIDTGTREVIV